MQMPLIEIRDQRKKEWFWVDNEFVEGYIKKIGPVAAMTYLVLCKYANNDTQSCYPSLETIAKEVGLKSRNVISKAIKKT